MDKDGRIQPNLCKGCKGSGGFEDARDALTLSLGSTEFGTETDEVFVSVLEFSFL
jgi:hypothetical protein